MLPNSASIVVELVLGEANRAALARSFDRDRVTRRTSRELIVRTAGQLEVARQGGVLVTHVEVRLVAVIPPRPELDHPTGQGHRDLLVALADGRCLELRYPLLEIRAAVTTEIRGLGRTWRSWRNRQASSRAQLRWRCGWMFLSVPQTCPSPPSLINCLIQTLGPD